MLKKYSDYIEISPNFESVVDIGADTRNPICGVTILSVRIWRKW